MMCHASGAVIVRVHSICALPMCINIEWLQAYCSYPRAVIYTCIELPRGSQAGSYCTCSGIHFPDSLAIHTLQMLIRKCATVAVVITIGDGPYTQLRALGEQEARAKQRFSILGHVMNCVLTSVLPGVINGLRKERSWRDDGGAIHQCLQ